MALPSRIALIIIFCLAILGRSWAQQDLSGNDEKPLRIEIPVKSDNETYRILPCGRTGVMLFFKSLETVHDTLSRWYFSFYDENLKSLWIKAVPLSGILEFRSGIFNRDTLYFLFQPPEKEKKADFMILRIGLKNQAFIVNPGKMPKSLKLAGFKVGYGKAVIGYQAQNMPAVIQVLDLFTGSTKVFEISPDTLSSISDMAIDTVAGEFLIAFIKQITKTGTEFFLNRYHLSGKKLSEVLVSSLSPEREIRSLQIVPRDAEEVLLFGTYGSRVHAKSSSKKEALSESTGFYFTRIRSDLQENINFINFLDLKNSSSLLGEKDVITLKKKSLKKSRDAREFSVDFNILLHPVIQQDDQFLVLAETYYPEYHSENFTDFDFYGQPFMNTYSIFDGYRFSNAIIAGFSQEGKLLWDNTLEIRNLVSFQLDPKVQVYLTGQETVLAYQSEGKIGSKIIQGENVVEKLDFSSLDLPSEGDNLLSETKSRLQSWYDNYFLSYGYEEIKNITEGNKRMVFYFTKVRFQ